MSGVSNQDKERKMKKQKIEHWQIIALYLIVYDVIAINFSYFFGLWLRFDLHFTNIPAEYMSAFLKFAPIYTVFTIFVFVQLRLYNSLWRFASFSELNRIIVASVITTIFNIVGMTAFIQRMPLSYYIIGSVLQFGLTLMIRFSYRYMNLERGRREKDAKPLHNAMIIGAGAAGQTLIKELKSSGEVKSKACCVIDDNPNKWGRVMEGVPIVGGREDILINVKKYKIDQILFAIPTASAQARREILNICKETDCELKQLPGIFQLANGEVSMSKMRPVAIEDLLGRDTIKVNMDEIFQYLKGKVILVYRMSNSKILFRDSSSKLISGFLSLIRMSDFILLGGLEMRSDLKTDYTQRNTERAGQTEKALYLLNTISAITDRGNNAEVRRKKDGSLTVYEVKKNIVTV